MRVSIPQRSFVYAAIVGEFSLSGVSTMRGNRE